MPQMYLFLYESESGLWGNIASKSMPDAIGFITPSIQVGNAIYWGSRGGSILEFDVENQSLGVTEKPANNQHTHWSCYQLLRTQENGLGLLVLKTVALGRPIIEIWAKKVDSYGTAQLVLQKTVELHKLLPLGSSMNILPQTCCLRGFDEEDNVIFLSLGIGVSRSTLRRCRSEIFLQDRPQPIRPTAIIRTEAFILQQWISIVALRVPLPPVAEGHLKMVNAKLQEKPEPWF